MPENDPFHDKFEAISLALIAYSRGTSINLIPKIVCEITRTPIDIESPTGSEYTVTLALHGTELVPGEGSVVRAAQSFTGEGDLLSALNSIQIAVSCFLDDQRAVRAAEATACEEALKHLPPLEVAALPTEAESSPEAPAP